jgi:hypothetical protein
MGTTNTHRSKTGVIIYRARIQRRGQQTISATFYALKDARKWLTLVEADIIAGRHFPEKKHDTRSMSYLEPVPAKTRGISTQPANTCEIAYASALLSNEQQPLRLSTRTHWEYTSVQKF